MKVQWRVAVCCAVVFIGWISADEGNRRKLIIHVPHVHRAVHKHSPRHVHKATSSHGKGHDRPGDHIHKHHHHFHDDEYAEGSHSHGYDDHPPRTYRRQPHHHHSGHRHPPHSSHHHSHPSHHFDHHGHDSHHVEHHRHPDHHDDDFHPRFRAEESRYPHDHHYPDHSHHRPHHYMELEDDDDYDCMEVCEKCKMKSYKRHHMGLSRGHDVRAESESSPSRPHPHLTVAKFKPANSPPTSGGYVVRGKGEFKPSLATGELIESAGAYDGNKYGGYVLPTALASNAGKVSPVSSPVLHEEHAADFDVPFSSFQSSDFLPTENWQNNSYFYGKYQDPKQNAVGYNLQRGQIQHTRYVEEETHHIDKNNDARGRDLRYLNRYKYDIKR